MGNLPFVPPLTIIKKFDILTHHVKCDVYEDSARLGGMKGKIEWKAIIPLPEDQKQAYGISNNEWGLREARPRFSILVVRKD